LELIYGLSNNENDSNKLFLSEENLNLPFGSAGYSTPLSLLKKIEKTKIFNDDLYCYLKYQNCSLWWFIYPTIFPSVKKIINFIDEFEKFIIKNKPKSVKIVNEFDKLSLIKQICQKHTITITYSKSQYFKFKIKSKLISKIQKNRFKNITYDKIEHRIKCFKNKFDKLPDVNNKIIFAIPTIYRRQIYDSSTGTSIQGEYIQGSIIKLLKKMNFKVVGIDLDYTFRGDNSILEQRLNESMPWFPMEIILSKNKNNASVENFLEKYLRLIKSKEFQTLFIHNKINFWKEIQPEFEKLSFLPHIPTYIKMINGFTEFFKNNTPKSVFLPYENGPLALAIIIACNNNKIQTIGIQHGIIYPKAPSYSHDIFRTNETPLGMPLPDFTLLFGNYAKNLLTTNGFYPKNKFLVFGNPEFFSKDEIISSLESQNLNKKYLIPSNQKIILFATSKMQQHYNSYGKLNYDEQVWNYLLKNFASSKNFYIILKPHPDENTDVYEQILKKYDTKNAKIINGNLFELLHASDLVISIISTVIIDALCLKKSVIKVDFGFLNPIYDNILSLSSSTLNDLDVNIYQLLEKYELKEELEKNIEHFVNEHYNINELSPENILKDLLQ